MSNNPYTLAFGKKPVEFIYRTKPLIEIIDAFTSEVPTYQVAMLTGLRGSGKTVMLTSISKELADREDWHVIELNPERDMLQSMLSKLYTLPGIKRSLELEKVDLTFYGIGVSIKGGTMITDVEDAIKKILLKLQDRKEKILITIDEVVNNKSIREFASAFQIMMRADLPVFLIMTGLFKNINNLQNSKTMTFLYRAPKFDIGPLSITSVVGRYEKTLDISFEQAKSFAKMTNGYSFAFQVLGYILYNDKKNLAASDPDDYRKQMNERLETYVYEKMWDELSDKDKEICYYIALNEGKKVKDMRQESRISSSLFARYRDRLMKMGLIHSEKYGTITFVLPYFAEYVIKEYDFLMDSV